MIDLISESIYGSSAYLMRKAIDSARKDLSIQDGHRGPFRLEADRPTYLPGSQFYVRCVACDCLGWQCVGGIVGLQRTAEWQRCLETAREVAARRGITEPPAAFDTAFDLETGKRFDIDE